MPLRTVASHGGINPTCGIKKLDKIRVFNDSNGFALKNHKKNNLLRQMFCRIPRTSLTKTENAEL